VKDPSTYSQSELGQRYNLVLYTSDGKAWLFDGKGEYWGMPSEFTLADLISRGLHVSRLERVRNLKVGQIRKLSNSYKPQNNWGVYRIDTSLEQTIGSLELQADNLKQQIDALVGPLVKQREALKAQIKSLKESRVK